jgi:hypothetical protein
MTAERDRTELIPDLIEVVETTIEALRDELPADARVADWDARDVAAHFIYWHDATGWGIASASAGGPAWPIPSGPDPINEATLRLHQDETLEEILDELSQSQRRLLRAAQDAPDLESPAFVRADGTAVSGRARLEAIARHWRTHLEALRASAAPAAHEP